MISDEERREVAERLRRFHRRDGESQLIARMVYGEEVMTAADCFNLPLQLANLIDRPTAKREDAGDYWRCTHCGAFTCKDAIADSVGFVTVPRCGNCGRERE